MLIKRKQKGGSAIGLVITLAVLAYGAFVGIQYIPLHIQSSTVKTILETVSDLHRKEHFSDATAVRGALDTQLNINGMTDMKDNFDVTSNGSTYTITVNYERELNLIYSVKPIPFKKSITLQ
jgi:hypothetical protein